MDDSRDFYGALSIKKPETMRDAVSVSKNRQSIYRRSVSGSFLTNTTHQGVCSSGLEYHLVR